MSNEDNFEADSFDDFNADATGEAEQAAEASVPAVSELMSSPAFKIGAVIGVIAIVSIGAYLMPKGGDEESATVLKVGTAASVEYIPGKEKLDPAYKKALEESNKQAAETAAKTGGSALPSPTEVNKANDNANSDSLMKNSGKDPLEEWKLSNDRKKLSSGKGSGGMDDGGSKVDCTPNLDQCRDLLKEAGLLEDICRDVLNDAGILEGMCKDLMSKNGKPGDMEISQCMKMLRDAGLIGADGKLLSGAGILDDGLLRDKSGNMILDKNGNPIRKGVCPEGYQCDASGNVILDKNGNTVTKGVCPEGYQCDANGNVMLDANGNPIRKGGGCPEGFQCDANGNVLTDANGNPIRKGVCPEGFQCDANGNVLLDANGNPIRKGVCPEGFQCDANGNVLLDKNGNPIRKGVCPDGYLCDASGNVLLDANGNPIMAGGLGGASGAPGSLGSAFGADGMATFVDPRKDGQMNGLDASGVQANPEVVQMLAEQMRGIISGQIINDTRQQIVTPKNSLYEEMLLAKAEAEKAGGGATAATSSVGITSSSPAKSAAPSASSGEEEIAARVLASPGEIFYAQTITEVNSDVQSTVMALVLTGPFAGGKALGTFSLSEDQLTLQFTAIIKDDISYAIDGVALDQKTSLPGIATDIDNHYFERIVLPAAAKFVEGYSAAVADTGSSKTTSSSGSETDTTPEADPTESLYAGMKESAKVVADELSEASDREPTVKIARGTTFGLLMLKKIVVGDAK